MRRVTGNGACPSVSAGSSFAAIKHLVTTLTCISSTAFAAVAVGELDAVVGPSGVTGVRETLVDVTFTALAHVARRAHTLVASDAIHTFAIVEALGFVCQWVTGGVAVVQVNLTVDTLRSSWTGAFICIDEVDAGPSVLAGLGLTFIDLFGAVHAMVTRKTLTTVTPKIISAAGSILAGVGRALIHLVLAVTPGVAGLAAAVMCVSSIQTLA